MLVHLALTTGRPRTNFKKSEGDFFCDCAGGGGGAAATAAVVSAIESIFVSVSSCPLRQNEDTSATVLAWRCHDRLLDAGSW
jgi:hypothetical protein